MRPSLFHPVVLGGTTTSLFIVLLFRIPGRRSVHIGVVRKPDEGEAQDMKRRTEKMFESKDFVALCSKYGVTVERGR